MAAKRVKLITSAELATLPGMAEASAKAEGKTDEGVTSMASTENTTPTPAEQLAALVAEVEDMLDRLNPLATGGAEGFSPLYDEADAAISAIPTKLKGATAEKKRLRIKLGEFKDTYEAATKAAAKVHVGTVVTPDWQPSEEDLNKAIDVAVEAVETHIKAGTAAAQLSDAVWPWRLEIRTKTGDADLRGRSQNYRNVYGGLMAKVAERLGVEDNPENREALERLSASANYHTDHKAVTFSRELDEDPERFKALFPAVAEAHPDLSPTEALIAEKIVNEKSRREIAAEKARAKAIERQSASAGGSSEGSDEGEGDEGDTASATDAQDEGDVYELALKASTALTKAMTHMVRVPVSKLEDEHRAEIEESIKLVEAKLKELRKALIG